MNEVENKLLNKKTLKRMKEEIGGSEEEGRERFEEMGGVEEGG